jgi:hypothetical protein
VTPQIPQELPETGPTLVDEKREWPVQLRELFLDMPDSGPPDR